MFLKNGPLLPPHLLLAQQVCRGWTGLGWLPPRAHKHQFTAGQVFESPGGVCLALPTWPREGAPDSPTDRAAARYAWASGMEHWSTGRGGSARQWGSPVGKRQRELKPGKTRSSEEEPWRSSRIQCGSQKLPGWVKKREFPKTRN